MARSQIENRNFLAPTGFQFNLKRSPKVAFFCNEANIPDLNLGVAIQANYLRDIPTPGDKIEFGDLSLRFLVDENLENYLELQDWIRGLGYPESVQEFRDLAADGIVKGPYVKDRQNIYSDGTLQILSSNLVEGLLRNHFKNIKLSIFSDLLGSCRALCKNEKGIVSILGTGSNSCYYDGNEINMQIKSLGYLLGDEGSGYALGRVFLKKYLRGELNDRISKKFNDKYAIRNNNYKILYEKNSNKIIANFARFINENKDNKIINDLIFNHFEVKFYS